MAALCPKCGRAYAPTFTGPLTLQCDACELIDLRAKLSQAQKALSESEQDRAIMGLNAMAFNDYVFELTGNEGDDDALAVLRAHVSKLSQAQAAVEWVRKYYDAIMVALAGDDHRHDSAIRSELRSILQTLQTKGRTQ